MTRSEIVEKLRKASEVAEMKDSECIKRYQLKPLPDEEYVGTDTVNAVKVGMLKAYVNDLIRELTFDSRPDLIYEKEDKKAILEILCEAFRMTRAGVDIQKMELLDNGDTVGVYFGRSSQPSRRINVACDSGYAMIKDIANNIDIG